MVRLLAVGVHLWLGGASCMIITIQAAKRNRSGIPWRLSPTGLHLYFHHAAIKAPLAFLRLRW